MPFRLKILPTSVFTLLAAIPIVSFAKDNDLGQSAFQHPDHPIIFPWQESDWTAVNQSEWDDGQIAWFYDGSERVSLELYYYSLNEYSLHSIMSARYIEAMAEDKKFNCTEHLTFDSLAKQRHSLMSCSLQQRALTRLITYHLIETDEALYELHFDGQIKKSDIELIEIINTMHTEFIGATK